MRGRALIDESTILDTGWAEVKARASLRGKTVRLLFECENEETDEPSLLTPKAAGNPFTVTGVTHWLTAGGRAGESAVYGRSWRVERAAVEIECAKRNLNRASRIQVVS